MNILVLIAIILALSGFKPVQTVEKGQATQGYYTPTSGLEYYRGRKLKMNTNANLGQLEVAQKDVEIGTYFRADRNAHISRAGTGSGNDLVFFRTTYGNVMVEYYKPDNYTTENMT